MIEILVWLVFLFLPGWFLAHALKDFGKDEGLVDQLAYSTALSSCILVAVFLTRTWLLWPIQDALAWMEWATMVCAMSFVVSVSGKILSVPLSQRNSAIRHYFSKLLPPAPSKSEALLLAIAFVFLPFLVVIYLSKFPIFSSF
jgi:uncharacterized membrane protein